MNNLSFYGDRGEGEMSIEDSVHYTLKCMLRGVLSIIHSVLEMKKLSTE